MSIILKHWERRGANSVMVFLRSLGVTTLSLLALAFAISSLSQDVEAGTMKIAYKKPIFGKANLFKDRRYKLKPDFSRKVPIFAAAGTSTNTSSATSTTTTTSTIPTMAQAPAPTEPTMEETTTPIPTEIDLIAHETIIDRNIDSVGTEASIRVPDTEPAFMDKRLEDETEAHLPYMVINGMGSSAADVDLLPHVEPVVNNTLEAQQQLCKQQGLCDFADDAEAQSSTHVVTHVEANDEIEELFPMPTPELLIAPRLQGTRSSPTKSSKRTTSTTTESGRPVPCTCGVFLTSQIKRSSKEQPEGAPVITNELDRTFPCNAVGQKQCQTKCLESIVQHLPNSANILCATLNRDCRKERAYLFIKNCRNQWFNTNLAAGKEYCCRNNQPYPCPLV
ncbi:follicle cell protein 3C-1 [Rhagoletis pomonella]|uniref:follicle cell protein 3C-1 n=1 Tax=Rhagoletis pomonella TaxID=28610 RepID=UPI0017831A05|nr:follicle cell protein 3C-1 [Rhagoletis pomonella]